MINKREVFESIFPEKNTNKALVVDQSHPAMTVSLDSCIQCGLCVRACRDVKVNDVLGMSSRGEDTFPVFDFNYEMGLSSCVGCGECVQACPTAAIMETNLLDINQVHTIFPDTKIKSLCPFCGVGCQTEVSVKDNEIIAVNGWNGPANESRLCVKGRFGYDYINSKSRLKEPLIRINKATKSWDLSINDVDVYKYFKKVSWQEAIEYA